MTFSRLRFAGASRLLTLLILVFVAAGCGVLGASTDDESSPDDDSDSDTATQIDGSGNTIGGDGIIYFTTSTGNVALFDPARGRGAILLEASEVNGVATQVVPADRGTRLLLAQNEAGPFTAKLGEVIDGTIAPIQSEMLDGGGIICYDNHAGTDIIVGHRITDVATERELNVAPVPFRLSNPDDNDIAMGSFEPPSISCPNWSGDRSTSAVSQVPAAGEDLEVHVRGPLLDSVFSWSGCNAGVIGFSPDDSQLALRALCSGDLAGSAGIYVVDVNGDNEARKIASGNFLTGAWSPDGTSIAAAHATATSESLSSTEQYLLQVIDVESGAVTETGLPGSGASVATVAWIDRAVHVAG